MALLSLLPPLTESIYYKTFFGSFERPSIDLYLFLFFFPLAPFFSLPSPGGKIKSLSFSLFSRPSGYLITTPRFPP